MAIQPLCFGSRSQSFFNEHQITPKYIELCPATTRRNAMLRVYNCCHIVVGVVLHVSGTNIIRATDPLPTWRVTEQTRHAP